MPDTTYKYLTINAYPHIEKIKLNSTTNNAENSVFFPLKIIDCILKLQIISVEKSAKIIVKK